MKTTSKIIIIIFVVIFISVLIYALWHFFAKPKFSLSNLNNNEESNYSSSNEPRLIQKISDQPVFNFWIIPETGNIYYLSYDGKVFEAKKDKDEIISNQIINSLNEANLSPEKQKILASFDDPNQPKWGVFDLIDKIWRPLPSEIINVNWGANDNELIGFVKNNNEKNLTRINLNENPPTYKTIIKNLNLEDVKLIFQKPNYLIIVEKPTAFYENQAWLLNLENLSFNSLFKERGLILKKSINSDVFFKTSAVDNQLQIFDQSFKFLMPSLLKTIPQKCEGLSNNLIYCFVPNKIPNNLTLPDDYFQNKFYSIDSLYLLNTDTGDVLMIFEGGLMIPSEEETLPPVDALNPQYFNGYLYFINRYDGYLYALRLNAQNNQGVPNASNNETEF